MSRPKLLQVLDKTTEETYSKLNNPVTVTRSGTSLLVSADIQCSNDAMLTFRAPCDCTAATSLKVNGTTYSFTDASGKAISSISQVFSEGSYVTVMLDSNKKRAYIQNSANNPTLEDIYVSQDSISEYVKRSEISLVAEDVGEGDIVLKLNIGESE